MPCGSDQLMGLDLRDPTAPRLLGFWPTGANPRGVVLSADGRTVYVMNFLSRDVSVIDVSDPRNRRGGRRVPVVEETLSPPMWLGTRLFHQASDPRMSTLGWIACASCHLDGGSDGTTWLTPEGPRQTMPLWALSLTGPPFHASATRDEVQDFHEDVERLMRGAGLLAGVANPLLGAPNGGRSDALDALAEIVLHGFRARRRPRARSRRPPSRAAAMSSQERVARPAKGGRVGPATRCPGRSGRWRPTVSWWCARRTSTWAPSGRRAGRWARRDSRSRRCSACTRRRPTSTTALPRTSRRCWPILCMPAR